MSGLLFQDVTPQIVENTLTETNLSVFTIEDGVWIDQLVTIESDGFYENNNQNSRSYIIRLYVGSTAGAGGTLVSQMTSASPGATLSKLGAMQFWDMWAIDATNLRLRHSWAHGGDGTARALSTSAAADDIVDCTGHGFQVGDAIQFTALTGGTGLSINTTYWVTATSYAANTFRPAATQGGAALGFSTDITAGSVRIAGSSEGSFGTVSTPGGFLTNRVTGLSGLNADTECRVTVQLNNTGANHRFTSRGIWVGLIDFPTAVTDRGPQLVTAGQALQRASTW